jgi:hypothetical protein
MWVFEGDEASITSSRIDLAGFQRVFIAFDETSRAGPFRVEVSDDDGKTWAAQSFDSTTSGYNDADWQWNFKQIVTPKDWINLRITQREGKFHKTLRHLRLFGDRAVWSIKVGDAITRVKPAWRGYTLDPTSQGCALRFAFRLPDSREVTVSQEIEMAQLPGAGAVTLAERFEITGLPEGTSLLLDLPYPAATAERRAHNTMIECWQAKGPGQRAEFRTNGAATITTTFGPGDQKAGEP